jgi:hypothetical protein
MRDLRQFQESIYMPCYVEKVFPDNASWGICNNVSSHQPLKLNMFDVWCAGATIQVLLFAVLAVEIKRKAPTAHTVLEIVKVRHEG